MTEPPPGREAVCEIRGKVVRRMKHPYTEFGKKVRKAQIDLDISQVQLAKMLEQETGLRIDPSYLQKILTGQRQGEKIKRALEKILEIKTHSVPIFGAWGTQGSKGGENYVPNKNEKSPACREQATQR